jgi:hypothetical protein
VPYEIHVAPTPWRQDASTGGLTTPSQTAPSPGTGGPGGGNIGSGSLETIAPLSALRGSTNEGQPTLFTITFTASKLPKQQAKPEGAQ